MKKYAIIFFLFPVLKMGAQVGHSFDTAEVKGLKEIVQYDKHKGFLKRGKQISAIREFDKDGKQTRLQIFVNRVDIPEFLSKFYYNERGQSKRNDYLMYDDSTKAYSILDSTFYFYTGDRLDSVQYYKFGILTGETYSYSPNGTWIEFWNRFRDTSKTMIYRKDFYNGKKLLEESIRTGGDTSFYYHDRFGRDSLHFITYNGKVESRSTFTYVKNKKIEHIVGILLPEYTFDKKYRYNKEGNVTSIRDKLKGERSIVKYDYYKNGLLKKETVILKRKPRSNSSVQIEYYYYKF